MTNRVKISEDLEEDRIFKCTECNYKTKHRTNLTMHVERVHLKIYKYHCKLCKKGFYLNNDYKNHLLIHSDKKYACPKCDKTYLYSHNLQVHIKEKHSVNNASEEKRTYPCNNCTKVFTSRQCLRSHNIHNHLSRVVCTVCGKSFTPIYLQEHMRLHLEEKDFQCTICDKKFSISRYLQQHMVTHSNLKPYKCEQCGKMFTQRSSLTVHYRIHTDNKPFNCTLCAKSFITGTLLKRHMSKHH